MGVWGVGGRYGWSVTAPHWCALSYVGINHDSEMTYFLTPQTNSTFNSSQGLCQTTFSPCSLSKVACGRVGLPRHNTEDFYLRHHLLLYCNLGLRKLLDNNFLALMSYKMYEQPVPHPFLIHQPFSFQLFAL